jgi:hypothetical protein
VFMVFTWNATVMPDVGSRKSKLSACPVSEGLTDQHHQNTGREFNRRIRTLPQINGAECGVCIRGLPQL